MVVLKMMLHLGIPFTSYTLISLDSDWKKAQEYGILQKNCENRTPVPASDASSTSLNSHGLLLTFK